MGGAHHGPPELVNFIVKLWLLVCLVLLLVALGLVVVVTRC